MRPDLVRAGRTLLLGIAVAGMAGETRAQDPGARHPPASEAAVRDAAARETLPPLFTTDREVHVDRVVRAALRRFKRVGLETAARAEFDAAVARHYAGARLRRLLEANRQLREEYRRRTAELQRLRG